MATDTARKRIPRARAGDPTMHRRNKAAPPAPTDEQRAMIIRMLARGYSPAEAAAAAAINGEDRAQDVVEAILRDQSVLQELTAASWDGIRAALPLAVSVIRGQLTADNDWIAQNAARVVFDLAQKVQQTADSSPTISFGSMPAPGMPSTREGE